MKRLSVLPEWRLVTTAGRVVPDPDVQPLVDRQNAMLDEELNVVIGTTAVELDTRRSRGPEPGDQLRQPRRRSDAARCRGGGRPHQRGWHPGRSHTYAAGTELTRKDLLAELPFGNTVVLMELSGADLLAALENGVSRVEDRAGRFPQIAGLRLLYDPGAPAGSRVVEVEVGGTRRSIRRRYLHRRHQRLHGGRR